MNRKATLQLASIPLFALLALGSSSPKKDATATDASAPSLFGTGTLTTAAAQAAAGPQKALGNCMQKRGGSCKEIYNFRLGGEDADKKGCETIGGVYESGAPCPSKDTLLGICTQNDIQLSPNEKPAIREKLYYYDEDINKGRGASAGEACAALSPARGPKVRRRRSPRRRPRPLPRRRSSAPSARFASR